MPKVWKNAWEPVSSRLMNKSSSFQFHWGHGIVLSFVLFILFMAYFYVRMSRENLEIIPSKTSQHQP